MAIPRRWSFPGIAARYTMSENLASRDSAFEVVNERGEWVFKVEIDCSSSPSTLVFSDRFGNRLCSIDPAAVHPVNAMPIERGGSPYAMVRLPLSPSQGSSVLELPGGDLEMRGNLRIHEYVFQRAGHPVARVSKGWLVVADAYSVDIVPGQEDAVILAATIVVDQLTREGSQEGSKAG